MSRLDRPVLSPEDLIAMLVGEVLELVDVLLGFREGGGIWEGMQDSGILRMEGW